jgi:hypothetical protein
MEKDCILAGPRHITIVILSSSFFESTFSIAEKTKSNFLFSRILHQKHHNEHGISYQQSYCIQPNEQLERSDFLRFKKNFCL